ncbi:MAG TPA: tripartite tricarboxylate transporter TctB family protein, partial [Thermosynergistes sp.]|nr:tripartite tricarboxylate transporter TctB family protein [Thermosynergistes sp.]
GALALSWMMPTFREVGAHRYSAPGVVPSFLGVVLLLLGGVLLVRSIRSGGYRLDITFEGLRAFFASASIARFFAALILSMTYVLLLGKINYFFLTLVYILTFILAYELWLEKVPRSRGKIWTFAVGEAIIVAAAIALTFRYLFLVRLP